MTDKVSLTNLVNLQNPTTAVNAINANNAALTTALDNTLSRDGTSPNQMGANLDMNSNQILNLPAPATNNSPARLIDISTLKGGGTIATVPVGGTSGQVLSKNSNTDYDMSWQSKAGSVTSVGLSLPTDFTVSNSPVTASGTLTAVYAATPTGTGALVKATSPALVTPNIGAAIATTLNGNTVTTGTGTLTLGANTLTVGNTGTAVTNATSAGGDLTGTYPSPTIATSAVTNSKLASSIGYSLKGNTAATLSPPTDFTIGGLTQKTSPAGTDLILIQDQAATGALKYATVSSVAAGGAVGSVNNQTGTVTLAAANGTTTSSGGTITISEPGGMINKFRNATFDIWQRGTSLTSTSSTNDGRYYADGWIVSFTASAASTISVAQATGFQKSSFCMKMTGNTNVTDINCKQRIESMMAAPLNSQNVTVQAQIYNGTGASITPTLTVRVATAVDNWSSQTTTVNAVALQACANATWTQVAYTFAAPGSSSNGMEVVFDFGNNFSTNAKYVQIAEADIRATPGLSTGLQTVVPPVEMRPIGTEYPINQRYYQQLNCGAANTPYGFGWVFSATVFFCLIQNPVCMRATPAVSSTAVGTLQALIGGNIFAISALGYSPYNQYTSLINATISGGTPGQAGIIRDAGNSNSSVMLSSEL